MQQSISEKSAVYGQQKIVLLGDSIFDNQPYVGQGESVTSQLQTLFAEQGKVHLFAVDGDVIADIPTQLSQLAKQQSSEQQVISSTHVFVSCGGNDLLHYSASGLLEQKTNNIRDALEALYQIREHFRQQYESMLNTILTQCNSVTVCTVYDSVPDLPIAEKTAIALFNEVILQEAMSRNLTVIDLRTLCTEAEDYAQVSPIEPSKQGASKIANAIYRQCELSNQLTNSVSA